MMTFCMPIDFVYKCACLQGSHRSGKTTFPKKSGKSEYNLMLVRKIQNLANGQGKMEQYSKKFIFHLRLWQSSLMYEKFLFG